MLNNDVSPHQRELRCYVADVDALTRHLLTDAIARDADVTVVGQATCEIDRAEIARHNPDVVFVEARMGVDAVAACLNGQVACPRAIVLVSSVAADASAAYELDATDFLLRPFRPARVAAVLAKVRRHLAEGEILRRERALVRTVPLLPTSTVTANASNWTTRIDEAVCEIETSEGTEYVRLATIDAMLARGALTTVVTRAGSLTTTNTLAVLERRVRAGRFLRTHRRAIVNMDNVCRLESHGELGNTLVTTSGARVPVARRRVALVRATLRAAGLSAADIVRAVGTRGGAVAKRRA